MSDLLSPTSLSVEESLEECRRFLAGRFKRWASAHAALPREFRSELVALLSWHALVRQVDRDEDEKARREALELLGRTIDALYANDARNAIGRALAPTVLRHGLTALSFRGPLEERKRADHVRTFETRSALLEHARRQVQPEGRLYLRVLGRTAEREEVLADLLAQALQLVDWLANLRSDLTRGHLHLAVEDLTRHGVDILELRAGTAGGRARRLVADQVAWARELLARGWPLCDELGRVRGRELAFVLRWHAATLTALEARRFDALAGPPPAGWLRLVACGATSLVSAKPPQLAQ